MTVRAYILMTSSQRADAQMLDDNTVNIGGRAIDNPLANSLGLGTLVGKYIVGASLLNDPPYERWVETLGILPIHVFDTDVLFLPEQV